MSERTRLYGRPPTDWPLRFRPSGPSSPLSGKYVFATQSDSSGPDLSRRASSLSKVQETFSSPNRPAFRTLARQIPAQSDSHGKTLPPQQTLTEPDETSPAAENQCGRHQEASVEQQLRYLSNPSSGRYFYRIVWATVHVARFRA
ncbi:MAG: hypothetical protein LQ343_006652 [Gyalolechia ehrenbergii]|nr:MAG: hypothetical protein LQ343_006652 [Gyalolechia ehrenbergii]